MKLKKLTIPVLLLSIFLGLILASSASANTTAFITGSVKISICGNGIVEGGEECDGTNLNSKTCKDLGYSGGVLSCDISCSFSTTKCISPTPTPAPISTSTSSGPQTTRINASSPNLLPATSQNQIVVSTIKICQSIPEDLASFAKINKCDYISLKELPGLVKKWVSVFTKELLVQFNKSSQKDKAHKSCDINNDGVCDIKDLSIILFYTNK